MRLKLFLSALILPLIFLPAFGTGVKISITQPPNAPYFIGAPEHDIDSDKFSTVLLKIKSKNGGVVGLFWSSSRDPQTNVPTGIWFNADRSNTSREYVFNLKLQSRYWNGNIKQLVIHPESGTERFVIESAIAEPSSFANNIRSCWMEFWGPASRIVLGTTVNNMEATKLCGIPINWYAYIIILFSSVSIFAYSFSSTKDLPFSWQNCGKMAIFAAIALWGLLEFSASVNQYQQLKVDHERYGFKSLEEKRAALVGIIVGNDFYRFIKFCEGSIKGKPDVYVLSSGPNSDFYKERFNYFLYPVNFYTNAPEYIIVINYEKSIIDVLREHPGFRLFKKYNEEAYILWKKKI
jgi:hypothetical protein